jgi:hypothetical protein
VSGENTGVGHVTRAQPTEVLQQRRVSASPSWVDPQVCGFLNCGVIYPVVPLHCLFVSSNALFTTMAPGRIDSPAERSEAIATSKPTVYLLDTLHPDAVKHAQAKFNVVLPEDPKYANWRENAEYLVIRGSYLRKDDVEACKKLKAVGKQGVGKLNPCGLRKSRQMLI